MSTVISSGRVFHRFRILREHPLLCYFMLTFVLSWAGMLAAVLVSPGGLSATPEQLQQSLGLAIPGMLLGPPVAGLLMTWLVDGRAGLHALRVRLTKVRVGLRWYAVALLVAPVTIGGSLLVMSLFSGDFLPRIATVDDKVPLLLIGLSAGVAVGICEELGWTGFATPRMRQRWGVLGTGVVLGVAWSAWHLLQNYYASGVTSGEVSPAVWGALEVLALLVGQLVAYRVLMVWVYDHTDGSLPPAMVMHASLTTFTLVLFPPLSVAANMVSGFVAAAAMWGVVWIVAMVQHGHLFASRVPLEHGGLGSDSGHGTPRDGGSPHGSLDGATPQSATQHGGAPQGTLATGGSLAVETGVHRRARNHRLGTVAAWVSAVCCLPYLMFKVVWTAGIPVGVTDPSVLDSDGWVAANALMAAIQLVSLALVLTLTRPWARRLPAWVILFPAWVGTGLLFQVVAGVLIGLPSAALQNAGSDTGDFAPWVFVVVYAGFAGQGAALAVAFGCHVQGRWGWLLGQRTGDLLRRTTHAESWPRRHLAELAQAVAAVTVGVALVWGYWAVGGTVGLSGDLPPLAQQASRAVGALIAVVGLLGLAGRWGGDTRFWVPAALTWVGSGALAAFDGLLLVLNALFLTLGAAPPDAGWTAGDTALAIKVMVGVLAAGVGVLALAAAAKDQSAADASATPRTRQKA